MAPTNTTAAAAVLGHHAPDAALTLIHDTYASVHGLTVLEATALETRLTRLGVHARVYADGRAWQVQVYPQPPLVNREAAGLLDDDHPVKHTVLDTGVWDLMCRVCGFTADPAQRVHTTSFGVDEVRGLLTFAREGVS